MVQTKTLAFVNNKGGSGKTTTCANVAYSLTLLGRKCLLVDGDMQLNLSLSFLEEERVLELADGEQNLYEAIRRGSDLQDCVVHTPYERLDLIPSSTLMSGIEYGLATNWGKGSRARGKNYSAGEKNSTEGMGNGIYENANLLKNALETIKDSGAYDYILIDAPPTLGGWVTNILVASDACILPVEASPWGLFGVANMLEFLEQTRESAPVLSLMGVVVTKVDTRKNYGRQTIDILQKFDEVSVFEQIIHVDSAVEWAQDNSKPIYAYKKNTRSAGEYLELAKEVERRARRSK